MKYLISASDAKERQDWINKLRSVAEFHASSIEQVGILYHNKGEKG